MRLLSFELPTPLGRVQRLGALVGDRVLDLNLAAAWWFAKQGDPRPQAHADFALPATMRGFLEAGDAAMALARALLGRFTGEAVWPEGLAGAQLGHDLAGLRLLAPVPEPQSLRDFYAFEEHVKTGFAKRNETIPNAWYELPVYYKGNHCSIYGPSDEILWPRYTQQLDFELELACVIGKQGRNIPLEEAQRYIAGYTIMNDVSARDIQRKEMAVRLGPAKGKDFATILGPYLVTPDEVGDVARLGMRVRVNGEEWSSGVAGAAYWSFSQMIAHVSMDETLYPGDVFGSGTVGRGCGLELDRWIQPGDWVTLEVDGLGVLSNRVGMPVAVSMPTLGDAATLKHGSRG